MGHTVSVVGALAATARSPGLNPSSSQVYFFFTLIKLVVGFSPTRTSASNPTRLPDFIISRKLSDSNLMVHSVSFGIESCSSATSWGGSGCSQCASSIEHA